MTEPGVRMATTHDIEGLISLYIEFHEFHVLGVPTRLRVPEHYDIPMLRTTLDDFIQRSDVGLFVAQQEEHLMGFVEVHLREAPMDDALVFHRYGYVQSLMVRAQYRKGGLGRSLLRAAKEWTTTQGGTQLRLDIWEFAAGPLQFYERLGFHTMKREMAIDTSHVEW